MRILWHSNAPWANSGYGTQTRLFLPRLKAAGHQVAASSFWGLEGGVIEWRGIPVYPKLFSPYGEDAAPQHYDDFEADVLITLADAWVYPHEQMQAGGRRWVPYFPVDHEPVPPAVLRQVEHAYERIVFSEQARREMEERGLSCHYVPHAFDPDIFHPGVTRHEARHELGIPQDVQLVGMVMANKGYPPRKNWGPQLEAARLVQEQLGADNPVHLYLHTHLGQEMQGLNLLEYIQGLSFRDGTVHAANQYRNQSGRYSDEHMRLVYSACDVVLNAAAGEGFGVPILEAQACGTPVIVGDWTAMGDIFVDGCLLDPVDDADKVYTNQASYQWVPRIAAVAEALRFVLDRGTSTSQRELIHRTVSQHFAVDKVVRDHWLPALDGIAESIAAEVHP